MEQVLNFINENKTRFLEELKDYLRIPSISTLEESKDAIYKCAGFIENELKRIGIPKTEIFETKQDGWKNELLVESLEEKLKEAQNLLKVLTNVRLEMFTRGIK